MRRLLLIPAIILAILEAFSSAFSVDRSEFAYVTQFGLPVAAYDGASEAGLHFKLPWPIQTIQRVERRLQVFDLSETELLTHDPRGNTIDKTITVSAYVCWRIPDKVAVDTFIRSIGARERAEALLAQRISSRLGAEIGSMALDDLISVPAENAKVDRGQKLMRRLLDEVWRDGPNGEQSSSLRESVRTGYGIELVDVRLRRLSFPPQVRDAIFSRIRSERDKKVAEYQSEGRQLAQNITSQAELEARTIVAAAKAREQELKGEADAAADRIRNQAHEQDPEFYAFLKKLAEYQRILGDNKSVLLLSSHRELFDVLFKPPRPAAGPGSGSSGGSSGPMSSPVRKERQP